MNSKSITDSQSIEKELIEKIYYLNKTLHECEKEVDKLKAGRNKLNDSFQQYQTEKMQDLSSIRGD